MKESTLWTKDETILILILDCSLSKKKQKGMRKEIVWNGQQLRKEQEVCKMEANLTSLQYLTSGLGRNGGFVTAWGCRTLTVRTTFEVIQLK